MKLMDRVKYKASQHCVACAYGEGVAILDLNSNQYFTLNPVAAVVWSALQGFATHEDLEAAVMSEFDVSKDVCRKDIQALLDRLVKAGLVVEQ